MWLKRRILRFIEKISAQDVTVYLLIELLLPFAAYLLAEMIGVSGIIAAVVAGVAQAQRKRRISLFDAELANISESTLVDHCLYIECIGVSFSRNRVVTSIFTNLGEQ